MQNSFKDFRETFSHRNWTIVNLISRSILLVKGAHIATFPQAWPCINGYAVVYKISKWNCQCLTGNSVRALGDNLSGPVPFLGFRESISFLT